jgi:hypothetical protein
MSGGWRAIVAMALGRPLHDLVEASGAGIGDDTFTAGHPGFQHVCCSEHRGASRMIRIKSPQDFWAGVLFVVFGCAALWVGRDYAFGTLTKMGPGYLPTVLSWTLLAIGGVLMLRALAIDGPAIAPSEIKPQLFVLAAIVVFALAIERLGLALAVVLVALTAALASRDVRWLEAVALAVGLAALCVVLFVQLLGQPFAVWAF